MRAFFKCLQCFVTGYQLKRTGGIYGAPLNTLASKHAIKILREVPEKGKDDFLLDFFFFLCVEIFICTCLYVSLLHVVSLPICFSH